MKCPKMYNIVQQNIRNSISNDDGFHTGEYNILIETQRFCDCYKEQCAMWDKEKKCCKST